MWIESQDGKRMMNLENVKKLEVAVKYTHRKNDTQDSVADGYGIRTEDTLLGAYPTEKSAKRAFKYVKDEIFNYGHDSSYVLKMPIYESGEDGA